MRSNVLESFDTNCRGLLLKNNLGGPSIIFHIYLVEKGRIS
jgi:hypothetical protein